MVISWSSIRQWQRRRVAGVVQGYLAEFVEEMKASGFVTSALQRHGIEGAAVAPPGDAQ